MDDQEERYPEHTWLWATGDDSNLDIPSRSTSDPYFKRRYTDGGMFLLEFFLIRSSAITATPPGTIFAFPANTQHDSVFVFGASRLYGLARIITNTNELAELRFPRLPDPFPARPRITRICGSSTHAIALTDVGKVYWWGQLRSMERGNNAKFLDAKTPQLVNTNVLFKDGCAINYTSFFISNDGQLYVMGLDFANRFLTEPTLVSNCSEVKFQKVFGQHSHILLLTESGELWSYGDKPSPMLGREVPANSKAEVIPRPVAAPNGVRFTTAWAIQRASFALDTNGNIWSFGMAGPWLGLGETFNKQDVYVPTRIDCPGVKFISINGGALFGVAVSDAGKLYSWGKNDNFQLGHPVSLRDVHVPTAVPNTGHIDVGMVSCTDKGIIALSKPTKQLFGLLSYFLDDSTPLSYKPEQKQLITAPTPSAQANNVQDSDIAKQIATYYYSGYSEIEEESCTPSELAEQISAAAENENVSQDNVSIEEAEQIFARFSEAIAGVGRTSYQSLPEDSGANAYTEIPEEDETEQSVEDQTQQPPTVTAASNVGVGYSCYSTVDTSYYTPVDEDDASETDSSSKSAAAESPPPSIYSYHDVKNDDEVAVDQKPVSTGPQLQAKHNSSSARDWNGEFQALLEQLERLDTNSPAKHQLLQQLYDLYNAFVQRVTEVSKIIIDELSLPVSARRYKPLNVGGIAGGVKHIVDNIFIKLCVDVFGIYGGDEWSRKAANLELIGLDAYLRCRQKSSDSITRRLCTPLMTVVDYRGFRVVASSVIPISKDSLVYGTADGGVTYIFKDTMANYLLETCGKMMNLKSHRVADGNISIYSASDIEVHRGVDNRYYVLDTSRTFPPEFPFSLHGAVKLECQIRYNRRSPFKKFDVDMQQLRKLTQFMTSTKTNEGMLYYEGSGPINVVASCLCGKIIRGHAFLLYGMDGRILFNQLRPEFVQSYPLPLSSDACSNFGRLDKQEHNQEVREATLHLKTSILPLLAKKLSSGEVPVYTCEHVRMLLHENGINVRHLGHLRSMIDSSNIQTLLLLEMIIRCMKNYVRRKLRSNSLSSANKEQSMNSNDTRAMAARLLNILFGNSQASKFYWLVLLKAQMGVKFVNGLTSEETRCDYDLRTHINRKLVFEQVLKRTGIHISEEASTRADTAFSTNNVPEELFTLEDIISIEPKCKTLSTLDKLHLARMYLSDGHEFTPKTYPRFGAKEASERQRDRISIESIERLFGEYSRESIGQYLIVAYELVHCDNPDIEEAEKYVNKAAEKILASNPHCDLSFFLYYYLVLGRIEHLKGDHHRAEMFYHAALSAIYRTGLHISNNTEASLSISATQSAISATVHPLAMFVTNALLELAYDNHVLDMIWPACYCFYHMYNSFPFPGDAEARRAVFGRSVPLPLSAVLQRHWGRGRWEGIHYDAPSNVPLMESEWTPKFTLGSLPLDHPSTQRWLASCMDISRESGTYVPSEWLKTNSINTFIALPLLASLRCCISNPDQRLSLRCIAPNGAITLSHYTWDVSSRLDCEEYPSLEVQYTVDMMHNTIEIDATQLPVGHYILTWTPNDPRSQPAAFASEMSTKGLAVAVGNAFPLEVVAGGVGVHEVVRPHASTPIPHETVMIKPIPKSSVCYALTKSGDLYAKGDESDDSGIDFSELEGLSGRKIVQIETRAYEEEGGEQESHHVIAALTASGEIYVWGDEPNGTLCCTETVQLTPRLVQSLFGVRIQQIALGATFALALTHDGNLYTWGALVKLRKAHCSDGAHLFVEEDPQTASIGGRTPQLVQFPNNTKINFISAGWTHAVVITDKNELGYIGEEFGTSSNGEKQPTNWSELSECVPEQLKDWAKWRYIRIETGYAHKLVRVSCGLEHTLVLDSEGRVYSFGSNFFGQLGTGLDVNNPLSFDEDGYALYQAYPLEFKRVRELGDTVERERIVYIDCQTTSNLALSAAGEIFVWGNGIYQPMKIMSMPWPAGCAHLVSNNTFAAFPHKWSPPEPLNFEREVEVVNENVQDDVLCGASVDANLIKAIQALLLPIHQKLDSLSARVEAMEQMLKPLLNMRNQ